MMQSFWKEQWFDMLFGIACFVVAIVLMFVPECEIGVITYTIAGVVWVVGARVSYAYKRIEALAKRVADLEKELHKEEKSED